MRKVKKFIGIDPDVDKNGVAKLYPNTMKLTARTMTFPILLDYLKEQNEEAKEKQEELFVLIEAGWLNKAHWHVNMKDNKRLAAAKGNAAGRNHEVGRKIAEMCEHWNIPYKLIKPLALKVRGMQLWKGAGGKITHKELQSFTHIQGRTNQEARDAALIAWRYAGLPIKMARK